RDADIAVPVRDVLAIASRRDAVDALQAVGRRDDLRAILAILVEAGIVLARTPRVVDGLARRRQRGRQCNDGPWIEIAIGPPVEPLADPRPKRIVDRRMA